jgi:hypothetical protein
MDEKFEQYQCEYMLIQDDAMLHLPSDILDTVTAFVEQYGTKVLRMKRDLRLASLEYDYQTEILERAYKREQPNEYQVRLR